MDNKFTDQEKQLKILSENFSLDIDTNALWEKVEAQLPPIDGKRRRPLVWWYAGGAIVILAVVLLWNVRSKTDKKDSIADHASNITSIIENQKTTNTDSKYIPKSLKNSSHAASASSEGKTIIEDSKITLADESNFNTTTKPTTTKRTATKSTNAIPSREITQSIFNSNRYDEKSSIRKEVVINQGSVEQVSTASLSNPSSESEIASKDELINQDRPFASFAPIITKYPQWSEKELEFDLPMKEINPLKPASWLPYLAYSSGVNIHRSKITSTVKEGLDLSQFDRESPLPGISSDLRFGFENTNGWRFGFGFNHSRLVNRYAQIEPDTMVRRIEGNVSSTIDRQGNVSSENGQLLQTTITNYDLNWHRVHDLVSVQLNVGKRLYRTGRFSVYTDLSVGRSIWSRHSGYYFTENSDTIKKFSSNENNPYADSGYNLGLSIDLEYRMNEFSISLKPFTLHGLNSMTQNSNYYQIENSQYGVQLGVVYRP